MKMASKKQVNAITHKGVAETCLLIGDYELAKTYALEAHALDPELAKVSEMIQVLDVYISANKKNGSVDRYEALRVSPQADVATIRTQFKKLAISVHPDRNKCVATDGAFKILTEAWGVLKNDNARALYDKIRKKPVNYGFPARRTFWTACPNCRTQFEYSSNYVNKTLACPNCRKPFFAVEMDLQSTLVRGSSFCVPPGPALGLGQGGPTLGHGQVEIPSFADSTSSSPPVGPMVDRVGPSVYRSSEDGASSSTRGRAEPHKRKRSEALQKPEEDRGTIKYDFVMYNLMKKLERSEKEKMLTTKAKKAIQKHTRSQHIIKF